MTHRQLNDTGYIDNKDTRQYSTRDYIKWTVKIL